MEKLEGRQRRVDLISMHAGHYQTIERTEQEHHLTELLSFSLELHMTYVASNVKCSSSLLQLLSH